MIFKYAELFAGILGFGTALDDFGGRPVFISEIDRYAQQAIQALGRGDLLHGDIRQVEAAAVPDHDLLVGGFPCQAFSVAGKRLGFEDMRGTLFFEAVRIAKEKRPKALLLENVKGLTNHRKGETISVMLHALNDIGYAVDMQILNSKYFDVPQNRERVFIVAIREDLADMAEWIDVEGRGSFQKTKRRLQDEGLVTFNFDWPLQEAVTKQLRDILEPEVDEKYYLSDEKVKQLIAASTGGKGLAIREATKKGFAMAEPGDAVNFQFPDSKTRRGRVGKQIANTLEASSINQGVVEQLTLFDDDIFSDAAAAAPAPSMPEARPVMTPDIINKYQNGRRMKDDGEPAYSLTARDRHGVALGTFPEYRIRKLTPRETWRLQSFSDAAFDRVQASGMSDSQLYKQAGNAVTVNTVRAIAEKLLPFLN